VIDILKKYVDTGIQLPEYQVNKLLNNRSLLNTYIRKRAIAIQTQNDEWYHYEIDVIKNGIKNNFFKEELLIQLVNTYFEFIKFIDNPSEKVQLAAVTNDGTSIVYIIEKGIDPSEDVQLAAVTNYGMSISYIKNPSENVQLAAVGQNGDMIKHIIKKGIVPSDDVQIAAVKNDKYILNHLLRAGILPSKKVLNYFKSLYK
jgi:ribosomal protein S16